MCCVWNPRCNCVVVVDCVDREEVYKLSFVQLTLLKGKILRPQL